MGSGYDIKIEKAFSGKNYLKCDLPTASLLSLTDTHVIRMN